MNPGVTLLMQPSTSFKPNNVLKIFDELYQHKNWHKRRGADDWILEYFEKVEIPQKDMQKVATIIKKGIMTIAEQFSK